METIHFLDDSGAFTLQNPEAYSCLYFPLASEAGLKSAVTPNLGGDCKLDQETFLLEPVSSENLHANRGTRNFWCVTERGCWSATGVSAEQEAARFTAGQDESRLTAGLMWQTVQRDSGRYALRSEITAFVPAQENVEILYIRITNTDTAPQSITGIAAVPIYGRSADNLRDHRNVTSMLHRIRTTEHGVLVKPTMSFDEKGHRENRRTYYVLGASGSGTAPKAFYPTVELLIGEYTIGKASTIPRALVVNITEPPNGAVLDEYQRNRPLLVSTFYYYFIRWYVDHFNEIRDSIDAKLTQLRRATASPTTHGRLRDTQFYLEISYMVLLEFCKESRFCSEEDAKDTYQSFSTQLRTLVQAQETRFKESIEVKTIDYLDLIRDLYKQGAFHLAKDAENFKPEKHDGLIYYDCLCLRGKRLEKKLRSFTPSLSFVDCISYLLSKGALKLVESKNTVQINGTGGKRFYAIKLSKLR